MGFMLFAISFEFSAVNSMPYLEDVCPGSLPDWHVLVLLLRARQCRQRTKVCDGLAAHADCAIVFFEGICHYVFKEDVE